MFTLINLLSAFFIISGIGVAIFIGIDLKKNPQTMKIMGIVWVLTGL